MRVNFQASQPGVVFLNVGPRPDRDGAPLCGFEPVHRVAQSYLGPLWVAVDKRGEDGAAGERLTLLRRVCLPQKTSADVRKAIAWAAAEARNLNHVNILSVLEVLEDGSELGVVYEHLEAEPLRAMQASATLRRLSFPIAVSLRIGIDLLMGLRSLHQAYARSTRLSAIGGLTPDSVLVARNGETKLCDVLVASSASLLEDVGSNTAKLGYAAPEQVNPIVPLTVQCDLFTVGVMLWELLTSRRLLAGPRAQIERKLLEHDLPSLGDVRGGEAVCPALAGIIDAALSADTSKRPTSALVMAEQLRQCGHFVASREEVAEFIAKLSSQRFEKRTMSLQSLQAQPAAELQAPPSASEEYEETWIGTAPPANEQLSHPAKLSREVTRDRSEVTVSVGQRPPSPAVVRCEVPGVQASSSGAATPQASAERKDPSVIVVQSEDPSAEPPPPSTAVLSPPRATRSTRLSMPGPGRGSLSRMDAVPGPAPQAAPPVDAVPSAKAAAPIKAAFPVKAAPPVSAASPVKAAPPVSAASPVKAAPAVNASAAKPSIQQTAPHAAHSAFMSTRSGAGTPVSGAPSAAASLLAVPKAAAPKTAAPVVASNVAAPAPSAAVAPKVAPNAGAPKVAPSPAAPTQPMGSASRGIERTMIGVAMPAFLVNPPRPTSGAAEPAPAAAVASPESEWPAPEPAAEAPTPRTSFVPEPAAAAPTVATPEPPAPDSVPAPSADFDVAADDAAPSSDRHAFSLPPTPSEALPVESSWRSPMGVRSYNPSVTAVSPRASRQRKLMLAILGTALGGALVFGMASLLRSPASDGNLPSAAAAAIVPPADLRADAPSPEVAPPTTPNTPAPSTGTAPGEIPATPPPSPAEAPAAADPSADAASEPARDFYVAKLDDSQLAEWFQLERRKALPACAERLGKKVKYTGKQTKQSRTKVKAARAALLRGKLDLAYTELCAATAHDPTNVEAQRSLAELALDMGDPARAKEAAERGLARAPKDAELLGILGDALALSGDIPGSRRTWLELDKKGSETQRRQRLAQSFVKAGEKASSSSKFARSRSYFRRALVLTEGSYGPSMGLSDALLQLGEPRAGLAWAERAARAQPKSARAQLLLGDAYAKSGKLKDARTAWQAARRIEPKNKMVALRLSRGLR